MKKLIILIPAVFIICSFTSNFGAFKLPNVWENDFSIKLYNGGGMYYGSTTIVFDSAGVVYTKMDHGKVNEEKFKLSENEKIEILKQLKKLRVDSIKTKTTTGIIHDKATTSICFLKNKSTTYCIASSAGSEIEEEYKNNFSEAWTYLSGIVKNKTK